LNSRVLYYSAALLSWPQAATNSRGGNGTETGAVIPGTALLHIPLRSFAFPPRRIFDFASFAVKNPQSTPNNNHLIAGILVQHFFGVSRHVAWWHDP
jgi:hypothetical protein